MRLDGDVPRYKTTAKRAEALRCFRELEKLIPECGTLPEEEGALSQSFAE